MGRQPARPARAGGAEGVRTPPARVPHKGWGHLHDHFAQVGRWCCARRACKARRTARMMRVHNPRSPPRFAPDGCGRRARLARDGRRWRARPHNFSVIPLSDHPPTSNWYRNVGLEEGFPTTVPPFKAGRKISGDLEKKVTNEQYPQGFRESSGNQFGAPLLQLRCTRIIDHASTQIILQPTTRATPSLAQNHKTLPAQGFQTTSTQIMDHPIHAQRRLILMHIDRTATTDYALTAAQAHS
ncbi:hypothetical protein F511_16761 [Dorcoceras hygrometricum]|uniref:Uncharacterized protein n=1 Tax=Dorcoceras hygrometricum TaxID=472368 RepID=A0A2Z7BVP4_9LAMI|nr:hypothetical protein F511_16761 [Dorcoceras hygrometricum]